MRLALRQILAPLWLMIVQRKLHPANSVLADKTAWPWKADHFVLARDLSRSRQALNSTDHIEDSKVCSTFVDSAALP